MGEPTGHICFKTREEKHMYVSGLTTARMVLGECMAKYKEGSHIHDAFEIVQSKLADEIRRIRDIKALDEK